MFKGNRAARRRAIKAEKELTTQAEQALSEKYDGSGPPVIPRLRECLENECWVRLEEGGELVPLKLWKHQGILVDIIQDRLDAGLPVRLIILKSRQLGCSTVIVNVAHILNKHIANTQSLLISHEDTSGTLIWDHICDTYDKTPQHEKNAKPLYGDKIHQSHYEYKPPHGSKAFLFTAGGRFPAVGGTFNYVHASEMAKWPNAKKIWGTLYPACPYTWNTIAIVESTAEGQNFFKELWDLAQHEESGWLPIFFSWVEDEKYQMPIEEGEVFELEPEEIEYMRDHKDLNLSMEQMKWARHRRRHYCAGSWELFKKEYPATPEEAFQYSGERLFDGRALQAQLDLTIEPRTGEVLRKPVFRGEIGWKSITMPVPLLTERDDGHLVLWEFPEDGSHYYIGGDPAEGRGGDFSEIVIFKEDSPTKIVGHYRRNSGITTMEFGEIMYRLGMFYNTALIIPEINTVGQTLVFVLQGLAGGPQIRNHPYPNCYHEQIIDRITGKETESLGIRTKSSNKHGALSDLAERIAQEDFWCASTPLIQQMMGMEIVTANDRASNQSSKKKILQTIKDPLTNKEQDDGVMAACWGNHALRLTQIGKIRRIQIIPKDSPGEEL